VEISLHQDGSEEKLTMNSEQIKINGGDLHAKQQENSSSDNTNGQAKDSVAKLVLSLV
jgi:hypothetical protein